MSQFGLRQLPLAIAIAAMASQVNAAGFAVNEHSAAGLGRSNAGEAAMADDASVIAHNPAAMTLLKRPTVSGMIAYVSPDVNVEGVSSDLNAMGIPNSYFDGNDVAPSQVVPGVYFVMPLTERVSFGFGAYTDFGFKTDYASSFGALGAADTSDIVGKYLTGSLAFKPFDKLSVGVGISLIKLNAELSSAADEQGVVSGGINSKLIKGGLPPENIVAGDRVMQLEGDTTTVGWNVGALYEFNDSSRIGLSYKGEVKSTLEGEIESDIFTGKSVDIGPYPYEYLPNWNDKGEAELNLPAILEASFYHAFSDQIAVHASYTRTFWSSFDEIRIQMDGGQDDIVTPENWDDVNRYALGATYTINDAWKLRVGYAQDETPSNDETRTLRLPDSDRSLYSIGATWQVNDDLSIDAGYQYIKGEEASIHDENQFTHGIHLAQKTTTEADIFALQANYQF
ncbi:long-chain fatty acid transport protein [Sinobacterium caligoides]|uniref:Long-chain fatty acid transport protein n=1 Tax=Sinobacterium caligoides TaxID=933926 RepID=A0A3N2DY22_9GAMM|nr:outer membrane protein transport protein [Sinobacterium caligoides]ROS04733.1 long-chain fatty acid transport protein [Sinobacterium caligoides]